MIQGLAAVDRMAPLVGETAGLSPAARPGAAVETTFADALTAAAQRAVTTLEGAEATSLEALQGEVNVREVVDTVMTAEQTLQTSIAIRDKIVTAYLEVSRMQI